MQPRHLVPFDNDSKAIFWSSEGKNTMITYFRLTIFVTWLIFVPNFSALAIDFDQDGFADFVLVKPNSKGQLEWYAVDVNDTANRSLGQYGRLGNHLAVGNWSGNNNTSKAVISRKSSGEFEWSIDLPGGNKTLMFGSSPAKVVSGLDSDRNGAIDPALITVGPKTLAWKVMSNPGVSANPVLSDFVFGSKAAIPFYANLDGNGDQIAAATVNKKGLLTIRYKNLRNTKVKSSTVSNFGTNLTNILPVAQESGKDAVFAISKRGDRISVTVINGKVKIKRLQTTGDETVVGNYLGAKSEVLAIRNSVNQVTFIDSKGGKSVLPLSLDGILVDDVNINSFLESTVPGNPSAPTNPEPRKPVARKPNPACSGVADSSQHLLYKPRSDTSGNAVIVFDSVYSTEFRAVRIELKDGTFHEAWWKGLELWGNPDVNGPRQHWRTNVRAGLVKDGAVIIADDVNQECRFVIPGSSNKRWE